MSMTEMENAGGNPWSLTASEMKAAAKDGPPALIEGLLPSRAVVTFAGEPGIGKSMCALSWAASVSTGQAWFGHAVPTAYSVLYLLGEGFGAVGKRVEAWEDEWGQALPDHLRFVDGQGHGIDLSDETRLPELIEQIKTIGPGLIVMDTFAML